MEASAVFDTYQREYNTLLADIKEKLTSQIPTAPIASRELEEADEIVKYKINTQIGQMEVELMSLPNPQRNQLSPRVKSFVEEIKGYKRELGRLQSQSRGDREALLGGTNFQIESKSHDQRSRLIAGTERLQDGSRRLEEAQRIALETEAVGITTLEDLNRQREQMLRTRDGISTADAWIGKSQNVLKNMHRRMQANKMITGGIIVLLVVVILIIVYLKWFS